MLSIMGLDDKILRKHGVTQREKIEYKSTLEHKRENMAKNFYELLKEGNSIRSVMREYHTNYDIVKEYVNKYIDKEDIKQLWGV